MGESSFYQECSDCGENVKLGQNKIKKYTRTVYPGKTTTIYRCIKCQREDQINASLVKS